jgi:hypothetical protein
LVVDMARMQYGATGRGTYGESYFLGTLSGFVGSMQQNICTQLVPKYEVERISLGINEENEVRIRECANRAWKRWQNRKTEGWCDYCGKGGPDLMQCGACKKTKVRYCCREHQVAGWKLHKHTCEKSGK